MITEHTRIVAAALAAALILLGAGSAFADGVGTVATMDEQPRLMSLTFAPLRLLSPMGRFSAEFNGEESWSVAVIGGFGAVTEGQDAQGDELSHDVWEIGGQARYYALGGFDHGLVIGAEVLYRDAPVASTGLFSEISEGTGRGLEVGPLIGYKVVSDLGLTFDAQVGVRYNGFGMISEAEKVDDVDTPDHQDLHPMVNLNVGWSF